MIDKYDMGVKKREKSSKGPKFVLPFGELEGVAIDSVGKFIRKKGLKEEKCLH